MYWLKIRDIHTKMLIETGVEKDDIIGNTLAVQWWGLHIATAEGWGSISDQGTKIPWAMWPKKKKTVYRKTP